MPSSHHFCHSVAIATGIPYVGNGHFARNFSHSRQNATPMSVCQLRQIFAGTCVASIILLPTRGTCHDESEGYRSDGVRDFHSRNRVFIAESGGFGCRHTVSRATSRYRPRGRLGACGCTDAKFCHGDEGATRRPDAVVARGPFRNVYPLGYLRGARRRLQG
jgi:hypothetical protein